MKVTLTWIRRAAVVAVAVLALAPWSAVPRRPGRRIRRHRPGCRPWRRRCCRSSPTQDLLDGLKHPSRWLTYSGDYTGRRHSPLKQITVDNVHRLAAQWTFQAEGMVIGRGFESTPLVMDGVLYITGNNNVAWASTRAPAGRSGAIAGRCRPASPTARATRRTAASPRSAIACSCPRSTAICWRSIATPAAWCGTRSWRTTRPATR